MISEQISNNIPPHMKILKYGYPHSNASLQFGLEFERYKPQKAACHPTKCDVINEVKLFQQCITEYTVANF